MAAEPPPYDHGHQIIYEPTWNINSPPAPIYDGTISTGNVQWDTIDGTPITEQHPTLMEEIDRRLALLASLLAGSAEEAALLTEALAGGPGSAAWGVYADWCEDCGRGAKADWLRGVKP